MINLGTIRSDGPKFEFLAFAIKASDQIYRVENKLQNYEEFVTDIRNLNPNVLTADVLKYDAVAETAMKDFGASLRMRFPNNQFVKFISGFGLGIFAFIILIFVISVIFLLVMFGS